MALDFRRDPRDFLDGCQAGLDFAPSSSRVYSVHHFKDSDSRGIAAAVAFLAAGATEGLHHDYARQTLGQDCYRRRCHQVAFDSHFDQSGDSAGGVIGVLFGVMLEAGRGRPAPARGLPHPRKPTRCGFQRGYFGGLRYNANVDG